MCFTILLSFGLLGLRLRLSAFEEMVLDAVSHDVFIVIEVVVFDCITLSVHHIIRVVLSASVYSSLFV